MTTTKYQIIDITSSYRCDLGDRATFAEAEFFARWHAARRGVRVKIDQITQSKNRRSVEEMAVVVRDNFGRIWTDLTWHGAEMV